MWHVWIRSGRGNSNYFYFQCLVFHVFQTVLITEFIGAEVRRNKCMRVARRRANAQIRMCVRRYCYRRQAD